MKQKLWLYQLPFILLFAFATQVIYWVEQGEGHNTFMRETLFKGARLVSETFTDLKFRLRGREKKKNNIIVVGIDDYSIEEIGQWPWPRNYLASIIQKLIVSGAKVVALDIGFSEDQKFVPDELREELKAIGRKDLVERFDYDDVLRQIIEIGHKQVVMGWSFSGDCKPAWQKEACTILNEDIKKEQGIEFPEDFSKFSFTFQKVHEKFDPRNTVLQSVTYLNPNIERLRKVASHSGVFQTIIDPDGVIRRTNLVTMVNGEPYPSLALETARVAKGENLEIELNEDNVVGGIRFKEKNEEINVTPQGVISINFRSGEFSFPQVSAVELLYEPEPGKPNEIEYVDRRLASAKANPTDLFRDAIVVIGATATAVYDLRNFPFQSNVPGVVGHATIIDNLLSGDYYMSPSGSQTQFLVILVFILGGLFFAYFCEKLDSIKALGLFAGTIIVFWIFDQKILFEANHINWPTGFFYIQTLFTFVTITAVQYIKEEGDRKFIKNAFSRYVAPAMVDSILKDHSKLQLGGEKKDLTIMFSDIRNFTSISEHMDPKMLSSFLNVYLGKMTKIVQGTDGTVDKFIGDAVMAFWGAPLTIAEHARRTCASAIQMQQVLREDRPMFQEEFGVPVHVGIGINSGEVSVGNMGSEENFNYTVIGDEVNLASRLEGLTKEYGCTILCTEYTIESINERAMSLPPPEDWMGFESKGKMKQLFSIKFWTTTWTQRG